MTSLTETMSGEQQAKSNNENEQLWHLTRGTRYLVLGDIQCHITLSTNNKRKKKNGNTGYHLYEQPFLPHVFIVIVQKLGEREKKKNNKKKKRKKQEMARTGLPLIERAEGATSYRWVLVPPRRLLPAGRAVELARGREGGLAPGVGLGLRVHGRALEGVGGVEARFVHVVGDPHEARVGEEDVVAAAGPHAVAPLGVAELDGLAVGVHGVHGVAEVVGGGGLRRRVAVALGRCSSGRHRQQEYEDLRAKSRPVSSRGLLRVFIVCVYAVLRPRCEA